MKDALGFALMFAGGSIGLAIVLAWAFARFIFWFNERSGEVQNRLFLAFFPTIFLIGLILWLL